MAEDTTRYAQKIPPPPKGEVPLTQGPAWGGAGGGPEAAAVYAFGDFSKMFGRNPSQSELDIISQAYIGADPNVANTGGGKAAIAQYYQNLQNSPDNIKADEDAKIKEKVPQQYDAVKGSFQEAYGRDPSQQELDHFAGMIARDEADAYSITEALKTLPEYTTKQDETARQNLRGELSTADAKYLKEDVFKSLQSQFAQQGRETGMGSAGFEAALANAAKATNTERERYLAGVGREDYANQRQQTINNYLNNQARAYQQSDQSTMRGYQLADSSTGRSREIEDYLTQQRAYNDYMQNYGRRKGGGGGGALFGGMQGAMSGATAGGMAGGPWGALAGGIGGAALGAYGGSKQRGIY